MTRKIVIGLLALLLPVTAHAQSTAQPVTPGFLTTSGCPPSQTICFVPYSATHPMPTTATVVPSAVTPAPGTGHTIVTGGTAVTVVTGPTNGGYITNPPTTASQGVTAENAYCDPVATPGSTDATANGTTSLLSAGQNYTIPALAAGSVIKCNAATSGHLLTVVVW